MVDPGMGGHPEIKILAGSPPQCKSMQLKYFLLVPNIFCLIGKISFKNWFGDNNHKKLCSTFEFSHQKSTLQSKENSNETFLIIFTHFLTAICFTVAILQVTFHLLIVDFLVTRALLSLNCFWKVKVLGMLCESRSWIWKAFSVLFKTKMRIFLSINAF